MDTRKFTNIPRAAAGVYVEEFLEISETMKNNKNRKINQGYGLVGWQFLDEEIKVVNLQRLSASLI